MKFFRLFKQKNKEFLVLDLSPSSVKGLVFEKKEGKNLIKKFARESIERFGVFDGKDFEFEIIKNAVDKVLGNLGIKNRPSQFYGIVGISPSILKIKILKADFKRDRESERISKREQKEIYQDVLKKVESKLFKEIERKKGMIASDFHVFKKLILEEKISGYEVSSIFGLRGKDLTFKVLIIFCQNKYFDLIKKLKETLPLRRFNIFHEAEGLIKVYKPDENPNRIFVDIGEISTLIFFFGKTLEHVEEIPMGGYDFSRELSKILNLTETEAESLKERISKDQLSAGVKEKIEKFLSPMLDVWLSCLKKKIRGSRRDFYPFSQKIFIFGGGSLLPGIKKSIEKISSKDSYGGQSTKVDFLLPDNLALINKTKSHFSVRETPIILLTFCDYE